MEILTVVIPCYNEEATLESCIVRLQEIASERLLLEIIIVDDCSLDSSASIAHQISRQERNVQVINHDVNQGKGAALRTGFAAATGDYVAVQDADLEYDPQDLIGLVELLQEGRADVVYGSRFLSSGGHRVLYFWHCMGNKLLTLASNIMTDLNLTDMETCYKVFRRDVIQSLDLVENRFGIEPEITAKIAQSRVRIFEKGITYNGRTYDEGKKIGWKDGVRALYCIFHYNAPHAPTPVQFLIYLFIGSLAAIANLSVFLLIHDTFATVSIAAITAFFIAAALNYYLCKKLLFKSKEQWSKKYELLAYMALVLAIAIVDLSITQWAISAGLAPAVAKIYATATGFLLNFAGRKYLLFQNKTPSKWAPSTSHQHSEDKCLLRDLQSSEIAKSELSKTQ